MLNDNESLFEALANSEYDSLARLIINEREDKLCALTDSDMWPPINHYRPEDNAIEVDIVNTVISGWKPNIIEQYSRAIAATVKFPVNTVMLHGMGCLSAAICRNFSFVYKGDKEEPCNLFVVTAQPPSTGKSGVNAYWMDPIRIAFKGLNEKRASEKIKIDMDIKGLKDQLKNGGNEQLIEDIGKLVKKSEEMGPLKLSLDDATPEALEKQMSAQEGWANIVSDESDAVNVMLGFSYGDTASKKTNHSIFLKMYAGEYHSSSRITRDGFEGYIRGSFAVLAQAEAVEQILKAGESGRGISERILLMREPHMLGSRDMLSYTPMDAEAKTDYINLVNRVVHESPIVLTFNDSAKRELDKLRNEIEKEMGDQGRFCDNMTRGAMGKADKHICKIASILWIASEWSATGRRRKEIGLKTTQRAIEIFKELSRTYLQETESRGYSGDAPKINATVEYLKKKLQNDLKEAKAAKTYPSITFEVLANSLRSRKEFANTQASEVLRTLIMPKLEQDGYVIRVRNRFYVSHKLID